LATDRRPDPRQPVSRLREVDGAAVAAGGEVKDQQALAARRFPAIEVVVVSQWPAQPPADHRPADPELGGEIRKPRRMAERVGAVEDVHPPAEPERVPRAFLEIPPER